MAYQELWRTCAVNYRYDVSNSGKVRRAATGKELKQAINTKGYWQITLNGVNFETHVLVGLTFLGPRPEGLVIDHVDQNCLNNCAWNLEYVTPSENQHRAIAHRRRKAERAAAVMTLSARSSHRRRQAAISQYRRPIPAKPHIGVRHIRRAARLKA